jgi:hypothetical protein
MVYKMRTAMGLKVVQGGQQAADRLFRRLGSIAHKRLAQA